MHWWGAAGSFVPVLGGYPKEGQTPDGYQDGS